ncbi:hypothetical protein [Agromyces archimandritae]|uniref:Uncharacterized protein n=1 Tax=Agromyces archimandritae TaxID=2781962 RepID=A0A975IMC5_9MICO|nr:hypothetical protein [Agromyces archimandritae]QTX03323.1 hypothetical protein G127AT_07965 [Agromyces archimandritae]
MTGTVLRVREHVERALGAVGAAAVILSLAAADPTAAAYIDTAHARTPSIPAQPDGARRAGDWSMEVFDR